MTTYYHGSSDQIGAITGPICLTSDWSAAEDYALRKDGMCAEIGYVHIVDVDGLAIADEDELREVAAEVLGDLDMYPYTYELADHDAVRAALAERGYAGVEYEDQTITGRAHDCLLIWDTETLTITDIERVEA